MPRSKQGREEPVQATSQSVDDSRSTDSDDMWTGIPQQSTGPLVDRVRRRRESKKAYSREWREKQKTHIQELELSLKVTRDAYENLSAQNIALQAQIAQLQSGSTVGASSDLKLVQELKDELRKAKEQSAAQSEVLQLLGDAVLPSELAGPAGIEGVIDEGVVNELMALDRTLSRDLSRLTVCNDAAVVDFFLGPDEASEMADGASAEETSGMTDVATAAPSGSDAGVDWALRRETDCSAQLSVEHSVEHSMEHSLSRSASGIPWGSMHAQLAAAC